MSSLKAIYQSYLAKPAGSQLTDDASLNYITTLTTINTAAAIVKHHAAHQKVLQKKEEKVLSYVDNQDALCLEVETTIEFLTGGGAYLPGLDDNFLADRVVTFPLVRPSQTWRYIISGTDLSFQIHIVHFDNSQKIHQVRIYWDQGSLLKLVDVIGSRAKSWPIRDGKDQARLIASSAAGSIQNLGASRPSTATSDSSRASQEAYTKTKPRSQSKNVTGDPHASLSLFAPREEDEDSSQSEAPLAPKGQTAKPPPRDYHDLFVGNDSDASPQALRPREPSPTKESTSRHAPKASSAKPPPRDLNDLFVGNESDASPSSKTRIRSPQKENMTPGPIAPKGGAGKNFQPSRLFDYTQPDTPGGAEHSPDKGVKTNPNKYNHFDFDDTHEDAKPLAARPKSKHQNNWDFEDFATPEPTKTKIRGQDVRHFGWSDDEPVMDSPAKHPAVAKARPDSNSNFEFQDDGTPAGERRPPGHPRGMGGVKGIGMYQNNIFDEESSGSPEKKAHPLATVTNIKDRRKDFDPHFDMTDNSPSANGVKQQAPIPEARAKVVYQMGAQWEAADSSPIPHARNKSTADEPINPIFGDKENMQNGGANKKSTGIKTGGDGMGGKMGTGRNWGFGDESDEDGIGGKNAGKFRASKIQQAPKDNAFWDF